MHVRGKHYRTVWIEDDELKIIDQRKLPWSFDIVSLRSVQEVAVAIKDMWVRGAGCIGVTAGYGMWLAAKESTTHDELNQKGELLKQTRPTAVNLAWAIDRQLHALSSTADLVATTRAVAEAIADEDAEACRRIGQHGLAIIQDIAARKQGSPVNILTHCNAGWLAFADIGSATAPIYAAHAAGIPLHVWVDETRPRNQGARLTAWELANEGVPHTVIADNTGGHLMQHGLVDMVITGADRVTANGDVANKIGTYLKALAARDNAVPFYVAFPSSTLDAAMHDGLREIPIEQRDATEVTHVDGLDAHGHLTEVRIIPEASPAANYAFDVTPARLITGWITEHGVKTSP